MKRFNIRVYGICINEANEILLADERIDDFYFTKFPGGGLEYGEGLKDGLIREWKEELNVEIDVIEHIYTTDFFQKSAFDDSQIISIYYLVNQKEMPASVFKTKIFDFENEEKEEAQFRWHAFDSLTEEDVTLPIDKKIVEIVKAKYFVQKK